LDNNYNLYFTSDGGKTWTEEEIPVSVFEESTIFLSRDGNMLTLFYTGEEIKVLKKRDHKKLLYRGNCKTQNILS